MIAQILATIGCALALWKVIDLMLWALRGIRRTVRAIGRAARGLWRRVCAAVCVAVRKIGAWRIRKVARVAKVREVHSRADHRLHAETIARLATTISRLEHRISELEIDAGGTGTDSH